MYPKYTLYPNGAFMMCESVGEFDGNVQPPVVAPTPEVKRVVDPTSTVEPVLHLISKMTPVYEQKIEPLLTMGYGEAEDPSVLIGKFEQVADAASTVVNMIRCIAVKQKAMITLYDGPDSPVRDYFNGHVGLFMKNTEKIYQQGIEHSKYQFDAIPAFTNNWDSKNLVYLMANRPELMDEPIFATTLKPFYGEDFSRGYGLIKSFEGLVDMINCVYKDPARMSRLEAPEVGGINFDDLMASNRYGDPNERPCRSEADDMVQCYLKLSSKMLRQIAMGCYDGICLVADGNYNIDEVSCYMQKALMRTVNIFAIGTVVMMTMATQLRKSVAYGRAIREYTDLLLNTLKTV